MVPNCLQHAVVQPLLKKLGLDESCLNNFVSKLSFLSNLLVKVVRSQSVPFFINSSKLFEPFQSDITAFHSTESALLKVSTDTFITLFAVDSGKNALLMLLDLTTWFSYC